MTLPLLSKERFCHHSNWMWLHYKREGMTLLPDSGGSGRLLYKLSLTEQISLNNSELNTCLWSDCGAVSFGGCDAGRTKTRHIHVHNEDAFSGRNHGRKQYPLTELRWQLHKALFDRMIYAGCDDLPLNAFTPATVQMGDRPNSREPSKVRAISDATHGNFHLHLLQQIPTSKVLYISICSRRRVSRRKWMQFPEYMLPFTVQRLQKVSIKSWNYSLSRQSCKLLFTYLIL